MNWYKKIKLSGGQAVINYRELEKRLMQMGLKPVPKDQQGGGHAKYRDLEGNLVTLPPHWPQDVKRGIINSIARQMDMDSKELRGLLLEENKKTRQRWQKKREQEMQQEQQLDPVFASSSPLEILSYNSYGELSAQFANSDAIYTYKNVSPYQYNKIKTLLNNKNYSSAIKFLKGFPVDKENIEKEDNEYQKQLELDF